MASDSMNHFGSGFSELPEELARESGEYSEAPTRPDWILCDDMKRIVAVLPQLGRYELRGVRLLVDRLLDGQTRYGQLDPLDKRDWRSEASEELADAVWYSIFHAMTRWHR